MRKCTKCLLAKPLTEFYPKRRKYAVDGWGVLCKSCAKANVIAWYDKNKARHRLKAKKWWAENKPLHAVAVARWQKANSAKRNAGYAERRALKMKACPRWANKFFIEEIYDLARLRTKFLGKRYEVDHIVPLNSPLVCGLHVEQNLQVIPATENRSKHNRHWPDMP